MEMYNLIMQRHSSRKFNKNNIQQEDIQKIIDAGLSAPSGQNAQPWHFTVIQNEEVKQELTKLCKTNFLRFGEDWRKTWANSPNFNPFYDPNVIIVISNKTDVIGSDLDCCFAIQNMILMAESLGISSCIVKDICWAIDKENQNQFNIPSGYNCFMSLSLGYAHIKNTKPKTVDYSKVSYIN